MKLLVDIGNTRLKAALRDGQRLQLLGAIAHAGSDDVELSTLWHDAPAAVEDALIASVAAPALGERVAGAISHRFGVTARFAASRARLGGVRNAYAQPERLGIDRLLGLAALHTREPVAYVLAGCGTALTLDALAADGTHLGGLICASPPLMVDALTGATARLQPPRDAAIVEIATNTADAIHSGAWLAAAALTERFVARAAARLGATPRLVLTGGGSEALGALLTPAHRIEPDLVLRGLAVYADCTEQAAALPLPPRAGEGRDGGQP